MRQCSVTACGTVISSLVVDLFTNESFVYNKKLSNTCEEFQFRGSYDAAFRLGQETHQILFEFQQTLSAMVNKFAGIRKVSDESLGRDETPHHTSHEIEILHKNRL